MALGALDEPVVIAALATVALLLQLLHLLLLVPALVAQSLADVIGTQVVRLRAAADGAAEVLHVLGVSDAVVEALPHAVVADLVARR